LEDVISHKKMFSVGAVIDSTQLNSFVTWDVFV
jgi:hypothetical protein